MSDTPTYEIVCTECDWTDACDLDEMRRRVEGLGMLRRATDPEADLVIELFVGATGQFTCDECGGAVAVREASAADWPESRKCEGCSQVIPPERLDAIPHAVHCAVCQTKVDRGEPLGEREFCDYCGGVLVLRQASRGTTRYVQRCSDCGR